MTIQPIEPMTLAYGDSQNAEFEFTNSDGTTPDLSDYNAYYVLSPYGFEDVNVVSKAMTLLDGTTNVFVAQLESEDTAIEPGAYTVKIILELDGNYYKKARGTLDIKKDTLGVEVNG